MKYIVIMNGKPLSGKTTFQEECIEYLDNDESAYGVIASSIDYIKDIYKMLGWNGEKTDKARKDLHTLKQMWIDNCNGPINNIIKYIITLDDTDSDYVIFIDIREESEIIKLTDMLEPLSIVGIKYTTVFIDRPDYNGIEYKNKSDDSVGNNMSIYQYIIVNNGSIGNLREHARRFIDMIIKEDKEDGK